MGFEIDGERVHRMLHAEVLDFAIVVRIILVKNGDCPAYRRYCCRLLLLLVGHLLYVESDVSVATNIVVTHLRMSIGIRNAT
jgi:hypothetical protein